MYINTDINVLGSLIDWKLISWIANNEKDSRIDKSQLHQFTSIKTTKSFTRYLKVINDNLLNFKIPEIRQLFEAIIKYKGINNDTRLILFWIASHNNDLLHYINDHVFFPAFYSGRVSVKHDEVVSCIKELKQTQNDLKKWSEITVTTTASKYLTLLKKFGLMEGSVNKKIIHPHLSDSMFILYAYWLVAISDKPNLLMSHWFQYSFSEKQLFLDRLLQKKFSKYFQVVYTGDNLTLHPLISYDKIYEHINKS